MRLKLSQVIRRFLKWADHALAVATVDAYRHHLRKFLRAVKDREVRRLKPALLSAWAKSWHEAQAVVRVFNWAVREERLLKSNPFTVVRKPARGMRRRICSPVELVRILRASSPAARAFLMALRETFARPQEIRAAKWEELCTDQGPLRDEDTLSDGKTLLVQHNFKDRDRRSDATRPRVLLVSQRLGRLLQRMKCRQPSATGIIFLNTRGEPWTRNAVRCMMRRMRRKLKMPADHRGENVVAYTFRHSQATLAASNGVLDRTLADLLGHVETRTTSRYIHLQVAHLRAAMERANVRARAVRGDRKCG